MTTDRNSEGAVLLPCPFCGCEPMMEMTVGGQAVDNDYVYRVQCLCGAGFEPWEGRESEAADRWNRRTATPASDAERLKGDLRRIEANFDKMRAAGRRLFQQVGTVDTDAAYWFGSQDTTPPASTTPASIPAAEVQALVEADEEYDAAREFLAQQRDQAGVIHAAEVRFREALLRRAVALRELAKLIPRNPE